MSADARQDRLGAWCAAVLTGMFVLSALAGWLGPLAYAPVATLAGLLMLPAARLEERDRPAGVALVTVLFWAIGSSLWSPYVPKSVGESTAAKLFAETILFGGLFLAARRAAGRDAPLKALAVGMGLLGAVMLAEGFTGAAGYRALREAIHDPIRPDLGIKNVAQGLFGLTLLAPAAILAGIRRGAAWVAAPILAGIVWPCVAFGYDAPLLAVAVALASGLLVLAAPTWGPRLLGAGAAILFLTAPALVWIARAEGWYATLERQAPLSWAQRMGYWRHASDWISDHPARGWGLDASRMFGPGIVLHPHDGPLQMWLELGLIGAVGAAVFWVATFAGLARPRRDLSAAMACATAAIYLTFGAFSFGLWQEWWLALGGIAGAACILVLRDEDALPKKGARR